MTQASSKISARLSELFELGFEGQELTASAHFDGEHYHSPKCKTTVKNSTADTTTWQISLTQLSADNTSFCSACVNFLVFGGRKLETWLHEGRTIEKSEISEASNLSYSEAAELYYRVEDEQARESTQVMRRWKERVDKSNAEKLESIIRLSRHDWERELTAWAAKDALGLDSVISGADFDDSQAVDDALSLIRASVANSTRWFLVLLPSPPRKLKMRGGDEAEMWAFEQAFKLRASTFGRHLYLLPLPLMLLLRRIGAREELLTFAARPESAVVEAFETLYTPNGDGPYSDVLTAWAAAERL